MLAGTVEVVVAGEAGLLAGLDEGVRKRIDVAQVRHRQRTIAAVQRVGAAVVALAAAEVRQHRVPVPAVGAARCPAGVRSEEHTSELQSLLRISYAVFCLKKKKNTTTQPTSHPPYTIQ